MPVAETSTETINDMGLAKLVARRVGTVLTIAKHAIDGHNSRQHFWNIMATDEPLRAVNIGDTVTPLIDRDISIFAGKLAAETLIHDEELRRLRTIYRADYDAWGIDIPELSQFERKKVRITALDPSRNPIDVDKIRTRREPTHPVSVIGDLTDTIIYFHGDHQLKQNNGADALDKASRVGIVRPILRYGVELVNVQVVDSQSMEPLVRAEIL